MSNKERVTAIFGANAAHYVDSKPHALGPSLARLVEVTQPLPEWAVLDVASGTGHTALAFAPSVASVVASDLTRAMLVEAERLAAARGVDNLSFSVADVEDLPFPAAAFDLVTCRIAPHHFPDIGRFLAEAVRVVRPGGLVAVVDNIVPGSRLRGKKARLTREAGEYVNGFEAYRDPSHVRCLSVDEWVAAFQSAGLSLMAQEQIEKRIEFEKWAGRHDELTRTRLKVMLLQAPQLAAEFLQPQTKGDLTSFRLVEGLFVGRRP